MFPNVVAMERDTGSTSQRFTYSFVYPISKNRSLLQNGETHYVTVRGAPLERKATKQRCAAWFPKGTVSDTAISTQCPAALSTMPSTLAWVDQSSLTSVWRSYT
jgi:hypothetical protein